MVRSIFGELLLHSFAVRCHGRARARRVVHHDIGVEASGRTQLGLTQLWQLALHILADDNDRVFVSPRVANVILRVEDDVGVLNAGRLDVLDLLTARGDRDVRPRSRVSEGPGVVAVPGRVGHEGEELLEALHGRLGAGSGAGQGAAGVRKGHEDGRAGEHHGGGEVVVADDSVSLTELFSCFFGGPSC